MADLDDLIPFLQQLVQRLRMTPPANEIALLKKATFKEMRPYFDALASGRTDTEVYKMIITYLGNPSGGHQLNAAPSTVASPPKATAAAPARAPSPPRAQPGNGDAKTQVRKIMDGVSLQVTETSGPSFTFELVTKGTSDPTVLALDFSDSQNIVLKPQGPSQSTGPLSLTLNLPTTENTAGKELTALIATASSNGSGNVSLNYKVALRGGGSKGSSSSQSGSATTKTSTSSSSAPPPPPPPAQEGEEPDDVTTVADGLNIIVRSVDTGYKLFVSNTHASNKYALNIDLGESTNLTFVAAGSAKLTEPTKMSVVVAAKAGQVHALDCNVKDFSLGSCDIRYKVSARVEG